MKASVGTMHSWFTNISDILKETASSSADAENRNLSALAKLIQKLDLRDSPRQLGSASDPPSDSLEKVSSYIDFALSTFKSIRGPMLQTEQQASFILALSETYETLGDYQCALSNYRTALELSVSSKSMQGQIRYRMAPCSF